MQGWRKVPALAPPPAFPDVRRMSTCPFATAEGQVWVEGSVLRPLGEGWEAVLRGS
jgi:hypothetical protein